MSSLEAKRLYYDNNTGLMPIIQALIAPPVTEEDAEQEKRAKRKKEERKQEKKEGLDLHPYYKKRGRSHNHDYCDACLEGGNLLCCDTCEASFHLECNDPPLHVDEIPLDMWQCRRCTKLQKDSPSKKSSPGKNSKRRKSTNSNNSGTSSNNYKKIRSGPGQDSDEEGSGKKDNNFNNHHDSGDSDMSSVSVPRGRGRPRKHPIATPPAPPKSTGKANQSDSDSSSVLSTRSKRFMKRRKKEPPNSGRNSSGGSKRSGAANNHQGGDQSTSSDEANSHTEERCPSSSKTGGGGGVSRSYPPNPSPPAHTIPSPAAQPARVTPSPGKLGPAPSTESSQAPPARLAPSKLGGDSAAGGGAHIGYLKYSSSEEEDSNSEKSLYFGDMIEKNKTTEEYLDENTGEIMTRSLSQNEYLNKLLAKKNTTSEIDDIERINELLMKTENMRMDCNIIKKIIGCSIPEKSDSENERDNAYDSDEERSSEEETREKFEPHSDSGGGVGGDTPTLPNHCQPSLHDEACHSTETNTGAIKSNKTSGGERETKVQNGVAVTTTQSSNSSPLPPPTNSHPEAAPPLPTLPVPDQSTSHITVPGSNPTDDTEVRVKIEPGTEQVPDDKPDEELCSLLKFNALWEEKFGGANGREGEEMEEDEEEGGSDSYEEWEEESEEEGEEEERRRMSVDDTRIDVPTAESDSPPSSSVPVVEKEEEKTLDEIRRELKREKKSRLKREEDLAVKTLDDVKIDMSDKSNELEVRNAMQILLSAVAHSNPEQFSLGKYEDKSYDRFVWPGTDKIPDNLKVTSAKRVRSLLSVVELDSDGLVPAPLRLCHACGRTCARGAPLLGCDYCPLHYHLDCLDPPLAGPPTLTWMCPAHPQHLLDEILVGGPGAAGGLVERSEAWDAWAGRPVNEEQVTREFLSKARCPGTRQSIKRNRIPAKIPTFVSRHYRHPPELAPSLQESLHVEAVRQRTQETARAQTPAVATKEEKQQFLRSLISLETQLLLLSYATQSSTHPSPDPSSTTPDVPPPPTSTSTVPTQLDNAVLPAVPPKQDDHINGTVSGGELDSESEGLGSNLPLPGQDKLDSYFRFGDDFLSPAATADQLGPSMSNFKLDDLNPNNFKVEDLFITTSTSSLPLSHGDDLPNDKSIDEEIVSLDEVTKEENEASIASAPATLELKREEQPTKAKREEDVTSQGGERKEDGERIEKKEERSEEERIEERRKESVGVKRSLFVHLSELFRSVRLEEDDTSGAMIDLSEVRQLDPALVQVLALEHITHLTAHDTPTVLPQSSHSHHHPHPYGPFVPRPPNPPTRYHAQLCPLTRKVAPVPMATNTLTVGIGPGVGLDLSRFGLCSRVSTRHAVIFYEMASNTYELVNLSEFGSRVDNVSYEMDTSLAHHAYRSFHYSSSSQAQRSKWRTLVSERIKQSPFMFDVKSQRLRIKEGMERRKKRRRRRADEEGGSDEETIPEHYGETTYKCPCISDDSDSDTESPAATRKASPGKQQAAWESTCLVRHGSLLQFGCFKFVFSVTEHTRPMTTAPEAVRGVSKNSSPPEVPAPASPRPTEPKATVPVTEVGMDEGAEHIVVTALDPSESDEPLPSESKSSATPSTTVPPFKTIVTSKKEKQYKTTKRKSNAKSKKQADGDDGGVNDNNSDAGSSTDTCSEHESFEKD